MTLCADETPRAKSSERGDGAGGLLRAPGRPQAGAPPGPGVVGLDSEDLLLGAGHTLPLLDQ